MAAVVQLNVYRLTDSRLGFYHTGLEFRNKEYTYCFNSGIIQHPPRRCKYATLLGTVTLGPVLASYDEFYEIMKGKHKFCFVCKRIIFENSILLNKLFKMWYISFYDMTFEDMNQNRGFGNDQYDVMNNSCNTFTAALAKR